MACATPQIGGRGAGQIEPQLRLAMFLVRAVTEEAILRQDGTNVAIEADRLGPGGPQRRRHQPARQTEQDSNSGDASQAGWGEGGHALQRKLRGLLNQRFRRPRETAGGTAGRVFSKCWLRRTGATVDLAPAAGDSAAIDAIWSDPLIPGDDACPPDTLRPIPCSTGWLQSARSRPASGCRPVCCRPATVPKRSGRPIWSSSSPTTWAMESSAATGRNGSRRPTSTGWPPTECVSRSTTPARRSAHRRAAC